MAWLGRRLEQRLQFLVPVDQGGILFEQGLIDLSQTFEDGSIGGDMLAQPNKGPDYKDAPFELRVGYGEYWRL
jgi:hypothetical protein